MGGGAGNLASAGGGERSRRRSRSSSSQPACQCLTPHVHTPALPRLQDLCSADFPLPTLKPKLEQFRKNAVFGLGFQMLRRKPVGRRAGGEAGVLVCPALRCQSSLILIQEPCGHPLQRINPLPCAIPPTHPPTHPMPLLQASLWTS